MKVAVLLNRAAGSVDAAETRDEVERVREAFRKAGVEAGVRGVEAAGIAEAAERAARDGVDAVVVGGGDGTVSAAAGALAGGRTPLGILPLGTLNHFAKDLGLPLEMDEAARVVAAGRVRRVDLGEVNGRTFVNNSAIGFYPRIVEDRDAQRHRQGRAKWPALMVALAHVLRRFPLWRVRVTADGKALERRTPLVFIGNNEYQESFLGLRGRSRLDGGMLSLYLPRAASRLALARLVLPAVIGRLDRQDAFDVALAREILVESPRAVLRVALDGEVVRLRPPLRYAVRPGALSVLAPAAA